MTSLYIVIPVYNRKEFTRDCLLSLQKQTVEHRVVIVDDGSTDGTGGMLSEEFPAVTVLRGDGNLFWTAAINMGIRHALDDGATYVLTLNNDTVATEDFLEKMMHWAAKVPNSLFGAFDIDIRTKKPYYGGEIINWALCTSRYLLDELSEDQRVGLHKVSLFPGRGLLIPRNVFEKIGLFAENELPHYLADYDFTQLARRNGFAIYCNYDAKLFTYPEEGGDRKFHEQKTFKNFYNHLFDIKGGGNLKNFTHYTLRNCPTPLIPVSLTIGYLRRFTGFWRK